MGKRQGIAEQFSLLRQHTRKEREPSAEWALLVRHSSASPSGSRVGSVRIAGKKVSIVQSLGNRVRTAEFIGFIRAFSSLFKLSG
ncbi:hypothetical protein [Xylanibacillus composti]|uniref:hypothetical protein n=1 Tax=Xylanibacillus composti TaxID=1572762 RepID=UPI001BCDC1EB|nr:hypothetical protein [Xylanibacillus composti]